VELKTILDATATLLRSVQGIGPVLVFWRALSDERAIKDAFLATDKILRPWIITREASEAKDLGPQNTRDASRILIHGYRAIDSTVDSEEKFQTEIEAVRAVFLVPANRVVAGVCKYTSPCNARIVNQVLFAGVPSWHAELVVNVEAR